MLHHEHGARGAGRWSAGWPLCRRMRAAGLPGLVSVGKAGHFVAAPALAHGEEAASGAPRVLLQSPAKKPCSDVLLGCGQGPVERPGSRCRTQTQLCRGLFAAACRPCPAWALTWLFKSMRAGIAQPLVWSSSAQCALRRMATKAFCGQRGLVRGCACFWC